LTTIGIKWNLSHEAVTTVVVGTNNPGHLIKNMQALNDLGLSDEEKGIIERIKTSSIYKAYENRKTREFFEQ
jgi:predicted aldo/keto reductase-like oxidoreductase